MPVAAPARGNRRFGRLRSERNLPEFQGRVRDPGFDYVENKVGTFDRIGHGTQMAGILAANKMIRACTVSRSMPN